MGRIPDEIIQQIRDRVDIVDLVGHFVTLKKSGRNHKGLCPFHDEKTPSFNVNSERGTFYCFGCQESGNADDLAAALDDGPEGGCAQAALAASIFHFGETTVGQVKLHLSKLGIPVRLPSVDAPRGLR